MQKSLSPLQFVYLAIAATILVIYNVDSGWSVSVDLAHHYALAFRIADIWTLLPDDPTLIEMNVYPHASHTLAAIVGMLFNSTFLGMQLVSLASLALLWIAYCTLLYALPGRNGPASALLMAGLILLNYHFGGFDLHGAEISDNFFFPQLAAQSLALAALAVAVNLHNNHPRWHVYGFLTGAAYAITFVHLLAALELLGVLAGLLLLDNATFKGTRRKRIETAILAVAVLALAIGVIVLSPTFGAMRGISENNGRLVLAHLASLKSLILLSLAGIAAAAALLFCWKREAHGSAALKLLGLYGGSISTLCLLQVLALRFHQGSEYAVKKYAFGISSFILVALAVGTVTLVTRKIVAKSEARAEQGVVSSLILIAAMIVSFTYCAHHIKLIDTSEVVKLEQQLLSLRASGLNPPAPGKTNLVIDLGRQSDVVNYMFSIAIMNVPRAIAGPDLLQGYRPGPFDQYSTIIGTRGSSRYDGRGCSIFPSGPLLVSDAACLQKAVIAASFCRENMNFSIKGDLESSMLRGFSDAELESRWTDSTRSTISCVSQQKFKVARITVSPFVVAGHARQRVTFSVNGAAGVTRELTAANEKSVIELPLPSQTPGQPMVFTLDLPDAVSPTSLGVGNDGRRLGIAVRSLTFE